MRRSGLWWITVGTAALALAGCGASSNSSKPDLTMLSRGVVSNGQLGGMVKQSASPATNATDWVAGEQLPTSSTAEVARLKRIGFVAGLSVPLVSKSSSDRYGLTSVEQFRSASGAKAELTNAYSTNAWTMFAVPGIPGAKGFEQTGGSNGGRNIAFVHGDYMYLIGSGWQNGAANGVSRTAMIAVAQALYRKVSG